LEAMLIIEAPSNFKIGDVCDVTIDGVTRRVIWRDESTLLVAPGFPNRIVSINDTDGIKRFICTTARAMASRPN
jgi:hypothetical protein